MKIERINKRWDNNQFVFSRIYLKIFILLVFITEYACCVVIGFIALKLYKRFFLYQWRIDNRVYFVRNVDKVLFVQFCFFNLSLRIKKSMEKPKMCHLKRYSKISYECQKFASNLKNETTSLYSAQVIKIAIAIPLLYRHIGNFRRSFRIFTENTHIYKTALKKCLKYRYLKANTN